MIITDKNDNKKKYKTVSRWIKIRYDYITKKSSLYDYAKDNENLLIYFIYKNKKYPLSQFLRLNYPIFFEDKKEDCTSFLSGYDGENWYNPLFIEIDDNNDYIRLFEELRED